MLTFHIVLRSTLIIIIFVLTLVACSEPQTAEPYPKQMTLSKPRDLWTGIRNNLKIPDASSHYAVKKQINWLKSHQKDFNAVAAKAAPYLYYIHHEVQERDLPSEIALLPMIESAYDPYAFSHEGAAGLWQLMPGTAMGFGIKQNWWYDGRRDIHASTKAALDYLSYLNRFFDGDWLLAFAAYDSGEGTVRNAVQKNLKKNKDTAFWSLKLPQETKSYIPRLLAVSAIIKSPEKYGIELPPIIDAPYFGKIEIQYQIDLAKAAKLAGISKKELYKLNPGYNRWATSPKGPHVIVLPINRIEQFKMNVANLPKQERVKWQHYIVKNKDNLSTIARKFRTSLAELMKTNHLHNHIIHSGQSLIIPHTKTQPKRRKLNLALLKQGKYGPKKIEYPAKRNERISAIARKFNINPGAIRFWNRLSGDKLKAAIKIVMWKSRHRGGRHSKYYIVQNGDNLSRIAKRKKVSIAELQKLNPSLKHNVLIKPKDKIRYV